MIAAELGQEQETIYFIIQQYAGGERWNHTGLGNFNSYNEAEAFIKANPNRLKNLSTLGPSNGFRIAQVRYELYADQNAPHIVIDKSTGRVMP